jgi:hypothetical protein
MPSLFETIRLDIPGGNVPILRRAEDTTKHRNGPATVLGKSVSLKGKTDCAAPAAQIIFIA